MADIDFDKTGVAGPLTYDSFGCDVFKEDPATPDRVEPDIRIVRTVGKDVRINMPDGQEVRFMTIDDPALAGAALPSHVIRVRVGQTVHATFIPERGSHTIHWHGINPTPFNDGVGHTSFEISDQYTYQWQPTEAGTYFYHCHKNTVLHMEMGMYGFLIVDPPSGPGKLYDPHPLDRSSVDVRYDVEALWAFDDVDPSWHEIDHEAGLCGDDVGFNIFRPKYFLIEGVPHPRTRNNPRVAVSAQVGQTILLRLLNVSYGIIDFSIQGLDATVASVDGRPLRDNPALGSFGRPWVLPAGKKLRSVTAQRHALLVRPPAPGRYRVRAQFRDWITGKLQNGTGIAETFINVT